MSAETCGQDGCHEVAAYSYIWPGKPRALICAKDSAKLNVVAEAMGFYIELVPLTGTVSL